MNRLVKTISVTIVILACTSLVFAAPFAPPVLKLSAPETIFYDFDGAELEMPLTVTGTPAALFLLVFTKDKGEQIGEVQNGFLGWHYVNKIDTCMYVSPIKQVDIGENIIKWNGKDADGGIVPAGEYTYYIWAYDNINIGKKVCQSSKIGYSIQRDIMGFQEIGEDGQVLSQPVWYSHIKGNTAYKWVIGTDPADTTMVESTHFTLASGWKFNGKQCLQPDNHMNYFPQFSNNDLSQLAIIKWTWVPNGESMIVSEWGADGNGWTTFPGYKDPQPGCITDGGDYIFTGRSQRKQMTEPLSDFHILSVEDGTILETIDMSDWWSNPSDFEAGGQMNSGPEIMHFRIGQVFMTGQCSCYKQMVDPYAEDEDDFYKWAKGNGSGTFDLNFAPDALKPWVCNDTQSAPHAYQWEVDALGFGMGPCYDLGALTWGLMAPDGTGLGYMAVAGESATHKIGLNVCDSGCAYDGIYHDPPGVEFGHQDASLHPLVFIGHDSIKGILTNIPVAVDESALSAFAVSQNSPNPFNPTTTITFTIHHCQRIHECRKSLCCMGWQRILSRCVFLQCYFRQLFENR